MLLRRLTDHVDELMHVYLRRKLYGADQIHNYCPCFLILQFLLQYVFWELYRKHIFNILSTFFDCDTDIDSLYFHIR